MRGSGHGCLLLVVHPAGDMLAHRASGAGALSHCLVTVAALSALGYRCARGVRSSASDSVPSGARFERASRNLRLEENES